MTIADAKAIARSLGMTIRKQSDGDFRVNYSMNSGHWYGEGTAYYTDDLQDAVDTAKAMADEVAAKTHWS